VPDVDPAVLAEVHKKARSLQPPIQS
jgi:hypothetical protein